MKTRHGRFGTTVAGLGLALIAGPALAQVAAPEPGARPAARAGADVARDLPGPIDSLQDLQDTGKMLFKMADTNNDGQISQKEAIDAGNLLVGGFFFRADTNGDGVVSQEEARQARETLMQQKPLLRMILRRAKGPDNAEGNPGSNPAQSLAALLDGNGDKKLQASELRQAVQTGVQGLFAAADTNRDGQLSPSEVNAAIVGMVNSAAQAAFQAADADHNGALSQAEFDKALQGPVHTIFRVIDANGDGQISPQEAQAARQTMMNQVQRLQLPEPANAPSRLIESGNTPRETAPVPVIPVPAPRSGRTTPAPAPTAPVPAPAPATETVQPPQ